MSCYFVAEGDLLVPVPEARGPWAPGMLHGRLLGGLAARAVEAANDDPGLRIARLTVDMFKSPPIAPFAVSTQVVRKGGRLRVVDVVISCGGVEMARARALLLRTGDHPAGTVWQAPPWDAPSPGALPDPAQAEAWDIRVLNEGGFWSAARKRLWARDRWALVTGEEPSPAVRAALAADLPNPMANAGDRGLQFINADLNLFLARPPSGPWIGVEVTDHIAADGLAIGTCTLYDEQGPIGQSTVCGVTNPTALQG